MPTYTVKLKTVKLEREQMRNRAEQEATYTAEVDIPRRARRTTLVHAKGNKRASVIWLERQGGFF